MELISPQTDGEILSVQVIGITETDVFCIFLGKVWKMRSQDCLYRELPNLTISECV